MARHHWKVFDDKSPRLDQFGVLLIAALVAVVALSMVDLSPTAADEVDWGSLIVRGYVVILFMLSMSAMSQTTSTLQIPVGISYLAIPVSGLFSIYFIAINLTGSATEEEGGTAS